VIEVVVIVVFLAASMTVIPSYFISADTDTTQIYEYDESVIKTTTGTNTFVYLGDSTAFKSGEKSNLSISNSTLWDTNKILQFPAKSPNSLMLTSDNLTTGSSTDPGFLKQIAITMKAGAYQDTKIIGTDVTTKTTLSFYAGGLEGTMTFGKPSSNNISYINYDKTGANLVDFLKVTDSEAFMSVMSPIVFEITVDTGDAALTSTINVMFDDSTHSPPVGPSQSAVSYDLVENQSGYSVLDVSVDSTYAGTDNYLLTIAKYEGSIVYNSYVKVPAAESDNVRLAFSSDGLQQVIIEIVSSNEAFGDSVPGYLAYCVYEPDQA